ncbi:hypothetical protein JCM21738_88 [Mesobacillus boroniphilus JCM 21738]|uniref:Uncharacterized protein n=1 Tax=Mesobacillus boroniphilus JCM 21738 TaxID=1294265 RepID=W4RH43_9BACI|nr:hypothetical protein JCM21738_88 [Mesobacillus boroniphilus JCM 21738]
MLGIVTAGVAPGLALLSYFYLRDQYGSEPLSMVFKMFIFGALLVFPLMFIQYVLSVEGLFQGDFTKAFGTVGLLEEFFKWFILYYTIFQHISFDEPYDGVIYSVAVSLALHRLKIFFICLPMDFRTHWAGHCCLFPAMRSLE